MNRPQRSKAASKAKPKKRSSPRKSGRNSHGKGSTPEKGKFPPERSDNSTSSGSTTAPKAQAKPKKKLKSRAEATRVKRGFKPGRRRRKRSNIPEELKAKRTRPDGLIDLYAVPLPDPIKLARKLRKVFGDDIPEPDESIMRIMVNWVRGGLHAETAARICGLNLKQFQEVCQKGLLDPDSEQAVLIRALDIADAQDEACDIRHITMGAKHAKELEWKRERKTPQRWGPKAQVAVGGFLQSVAPPVRAEDVPVEDAGIFFALSEYLGLLPRGNGNGADDPNVIDISAHAPPEPEPVPEDSPEPPGVE